MNEEDWMREEDDEEMEEKRRRMVREMTDWYGSLPESVMEDGMMDTIGSELTVSLGIPWRVFPSMEDTLVSLIVRESRLGRERGGSWKGGNDDGDRDGVVYLIDWIVSHIKTSQSGFNTFECIGIDGMKFIPSNIEILERAKTSPVICLDLEKEKFIWVQEIQRKLKSERIKGNSHLSDVVSSQRESLE